MRVLLLRPMEALYRLLYHQLAFTYDLVAATVSMGRWKDWTLAVTQFVAGGPILELGFGTGHLQSAFRERAFTAFGLDESPQMVQLAKQRLRKLGEQELRLVRGQAQVMPFASGCIQSIVATFPSEYAFQTGTLAEARRVLRRSGTLVILPAVLPGGTRLAERFVTWLFRWTGESPASFAELERRLSPVIKSARFEVKTHRVKQGSALLMVLTAEPIE